MNRFLAPSPLPARAIVTDDPMRVEMLAAHHLEQAKRVGDSRGMTAYAGTYLGKPVGIYAVGYGESSALMYAKEIVGGGARYLIPVGECVSALPALKLGDIVLAASSSGARGTFQAARALNQAAAAAATSLSIPVHCLPVFTDDLLWLDEREETSGKEVTDFSTNAVFWYAQRKGVSAGSILTVSEHLSTGQRMEDAERQSRFHGAARLAFESLAKL